jgi:predicted phosphodiesterase
VIIFGHTHHIENRWIGGKLYFNPGSVSHGDKLIPDPYFGLLKFYDDGRIEACLVPLTGAAIRNKKWELIR